MVPFLASITQVLLAKGTIFTEGSSPIMPYIKPFAPGNPGLEGRCNRERTNANGLWSDEGRPTDRRKYDNDGRDERRNRPGPFLRDTKTSDMGMK